VHGTTLLHIAAIFDELEMRSGCSIAAGIFVSRESLRLIEGR